jgi:beta-N-acetylhexosaminidase
MLHIKLKKLMASIIIFALGSCSYPMDKNRLSQNQGSTYNTTITLNDFERSIAQRLMISLRYFCEDGLAGNKYCQTPLTQLPQSIAQMMTETEVGGVVLFAENIESHQQVIQLTNDLQQAALQSKLKSPILIGIDQEGGRVVRLKRNDSTAFSGNMAIGATYPQHGVYYAAQVGKVIASELNSLGINLNFAPDVDININPDNPVINVRSFGENPQRVSELGIAMMDAMQQQNVIATLKHFPGHGNTNIDSHTGLPVVDDDQQVLEKIDLVPFQAAINQSNPGMIMTAHIQYPNLDPSTLENNQGENIVKPATMSHKILTELLRNKMGFKGLIITDALNMAGISHHFDLEDATATSLMAGADIALMPFKIREPLDINRFKHFVRNVSNKILQNDNAKPLVVKSIQRIVNLKKEFDLTANLYKPLDSNIQKEIILDHKRIEINLAKDSITLLKNSVIDNVKTVPLIYKNNSNIHIIVQDTEQLAVIKKAFYFSLSLDGRSDFHITHTLLSEYDKTETENKIKNSNVTIVFYSERRESAVVKGEVDELVNDEQSQEMIERGRLNALLASLSFAQEQNKKSIVVGMQSPYEMRQFLTFSDAILVAYDASIYEDKVTQEYVGVTYLVAVNALLGVQKIHGVLPVTLSREND